MNQQTTVKLTDLYPTSINRHKIIKLFIFNILKSNGKQVSNIE